MRLIWGGDIFGSTIGPVVPYCGQLMAAQALATIGSCQTAAKSSDCIALPVASLVSKG